MNNNCTTPSPNSNTLQLIDANATHLPQACADQSTLDTVMGDFFVLLGAVAVLMIIIAGVRYVMARGNADKITQAKNMILYSVIGLVIAALAYSIVTFVINKTG